MLLANLRKELSSLHQEFIKYRLVSWTSGNVSARDPKTGLVAIKPSGIKYENLTPEAIVIVNLEGKVIEGSFKPSVDCESHLYIYRNRPDIYGVAHTHSPYATAFAAVGRSIPAALTAIADEFGGPIKCTNYAPVGSDAIGKAILETIEHSSAVLLKHHGVFTIGISAEAAVKAAVMVEDAARTVFLAEQLGTVKSLSLEDIAKAFKKNQKDYGQKKAAPVR